MWLWHSYSAFRSPFFLSLSLFSEEFQFYVGSTCGRASNFSLTNRRVSKCSPGESMRSRGGVMSRLDFTLRSLAGFKVTATFVESSDIIGSVSRLAVRTPLINYYATSLRRELLSRRSQEFVSRVAEAACNWLSRFTSGTRFIRIDRLRYLSSLY